MPHKIKAITTITNPTTTTTTTTATLTTNLNTLNNQKTKTENVQATAPIKKKLNPTFAKILNSFNK